LPSTLAKEQTWSTSSTAPLTDQCVLSPLSFNDDRHPAAAKIERKLIDFPISITHPKCFAEFGVLKDGSIEQIL
jgi:hypothetical protein